MKYEFHETRDERRRDGETLILSTILIAMQI